MPIHDWSRVDANLFHDFHQTWCITIRNALNSGLLPSGYSALVEQHTGGLIPDVLALQRGAPRRRPAGTAGTVITAQPPPVQRVMKAKKVLLAARASHIRIRHRLGDVVCVIEVVSPGNKSGRYPLQSFVEKSVAFLRQGVNLLVIDLFPPSSRNPQGIHQEIWYEIDEEPFELPPDKPLTLAAYAAGDPLADVPTVAYVQPVAVGDVLPDMPAYLDYDSYVPVPLEATYQAAWATCPADMRTLVETGKLPDEEEPS